jgi:hypothetical protein
MNIYDYFCMLDLHFRINEGKQIKHVNLLQRIFCLLHFIGTVSFHLRMEQFYFIIKQVRVLFSYVGKQRKKMKKDEREILTIL